MEYDIKELEQEVLRIRKQFFELLESKHPQYVPLYLSRYEQALGPYPTQMKLSAIFDILRTWHALQER